jgi:hypothetical protein
LQDTEFSLGQLRDPEPQLPQRDAGAYSRPRSASCAASADYNAFTDLFTEDCTYIEHVFGEMHGRDAVRQSIVPLMKQSPDAHARSWRWARVLGDELVDGRLRRKREVVTRRRHLQPRALRHLAHWLAISERRASGLWSVGVETDQGELTIRA